MVAGDGDGDVEVRMRFRFPKAGGRDRSCSSSSCTLAAFFDGVARFVSWLANFPMTTELACNFLGDFLSVCVGIVRQRTKPGEQQTRTARTKQVLNMCSPIESRSGKIRQVAATEPSPSRNGQCLEDENREE